MGDILTLAKLVEILRELFLDFAVFFGVPYLKKVLTGRQKRADDHVVLEEAREHLRTGDREKAREVLRRHFLGAGKADEQILDQDLEAVVRIRWATSLQVQDLNRWLALDKRIRTKFRDAVTIQDDAMLRLGIIAEYAKLDDASRLARMTATGKLDPEANEVIWEWLKLNVPVLWNAVCGLAASAQPHVAAAATAIGQKVASAANGLAGGVNSVGGAVVTLNDELNRVGLILQDHANRPEPEGLLGLIFKVNN